MILSFVAVSVTTMATPAKPGVWKTITLADGTQLRVELRGDENLSYWQAADGRRFVKDADTDLFIEADMQNLQYYAAQRREAAPLKSQPRRVSIGGTHPDFVGKKKGLIILAQFTDVKFQSGHDADFYTHVANDEGYTSEDGYVGSIRDYFLAQSYGQFDLTFDVVGPIDLKYEQSYYGKNSTYMKDVNAQEMITEAVSAAAEELGDFSDYDWFDGGYVDQVFVIYAGMGEADGGGENTIWPHRSNLWYTRTYAGKKVSVYACSNEMRSETQVDGIGAFCHEFSHCLGLPDLYDTSYSGNYGMSYWDIMEAGCYLGDSFQPCGYSGYERNYCGWKEPIILTDDTHVSGLKGIEDGGDYYIIKNDAYENEYYILENRTKTGWDSNLMGEGLLVTYIDFSRTLWQSNMVNTVDGTQNDHQRYTIFPADNNTTVSSAGISGDVYPYNRNNLLTDYSVPAATLYHANSAGNKYMNKPVTNITKAEDGTISFDFANEVGKEEEPLPTGLFFRETFSYCNGDGGNDDNWAATNANMSNLMTDNQGWTVTNGNGGDGCGVFGTGSLKGVATTPAITITEPATLTFKAAPYNSAPLALTIAVEEGDVTLSETSFNMVRNQWTDFTTAITADSYPATFKLTFSNTRRRFFLDDIYVVAQSAAGVSSIKTEAAPKYSPIYTIDGRYAGTNKASLAKGIYICGGKKVVVK